MQDKLTAYIKQYVSARNGAVALSDESVILEHIPSMDFVELLLELEGELGCAINFAELSPEQTATVAGLAAWLVSRSEAA